MDKEFFKQRLSQVQTWCGGENRAEDLRSTELKPSGQDFLRISMAERQTIVESVATRRAELLQS